MGLDITRYPEYPPEIKREIYDGVQIPFENKSFDISLLFYTLHHTDDPLRLFSEAVRVTKRRILLIEEFNTLECSDVQEKEALVALGLNPDMKHRGLKPNELSFLIASQGAKVESIVLLKSKTKNRVIKTLYIISV